MTAAAREEGVVLGGFRGDFVGDGGVLVDVVVGVDVCRGEKMPSAEEEESWVDGKRAFRGDERIFFGEYSPFHALTIS